MSPTKTFKYFAFHKISMVQLPIAEIIIGKRMRELNDAKVTDFIQSIQEAELGLKIVVSRLNGIIMNF